MPTLMQDMKISHDAAQRCVECGLCQQVQDEGCGCPAGMWGPFAATLAQQAQEGGVDERMQRLLFTCSLCGACTVRCPSCIYAPFVVREGRAVFLETNPAQAQRWRAMQVDLTGNTFTSIRKALDVRYDDALDPEAGTCETLFFPGCTLNTYAPELTRAVTAHLREAGAADGMTALCCGNPLWGIGLARRCNDYAYELGKRLAAHGVKRIVAGCPNCLRALSTGQAEGFIGPGIEMLPLAQVLLDLGMGVGRQRSVAPEAHTFSVHDSCPNRSNNASGAAVRALLPPGSCIEMQHAHEETICCGSGGMVSFYDVGACKHRRARRADEFEESGADCLVTDCVSCANSMLRADRDLPVRHYLELLFDIDIDWARLRATNRTAADRGGYGFGSHDDEPLLAREEH